MNSPTITWRLRKIGRGWWPEPRERSQPRWLAARSPIARAAAKPPGLKPARAESAAERVRDGVAVSTPRPWLAASLA